MNLSEIERKFLVKGEFKHLAISHHQICQGYLSTDPERSVRIRIYGDAGFITIKGHSNKSGLTRFEWEKEISLEEAQQLLTLCLPGVIEKTRYKIPYKDFIFEVDEFTGANQGLILAEVELQSEDQNPELPDWIDVEVTGNVQYYNSWLAQHPFNMSK